ncbi:hypothetical protein MSG28_004352 [Choristoneura fumiferana]|uniref:Uncharacterized protein n=1 Tax=Choristoneura fumiferana TaxID=7141 RepID=A0ACC0KJ35_CHOFU|nr:hypothetical protein MSG28_004352 [Choristoneura fumiferana]
MGYNYEQMAVGVEKLLDGDGASASAASHPTKAPVTGDWRFIGEAYVQQWKKMILRHELKVHNRPKMPSGVLPSYMRQQEDVT